jgi:GNAT superfamily N-acetyltransferase
MYWILGAEYHRRARDKNRRALRRATGAHPPPGLLALDETGAALGWCRVTPREELAWLNTRRDLAPIDDLPVWSVPCFYVRRDARGQGVMSSLIDAAVDHARDAGAPALEAYPIDTSVPGSTSNVFPGTATAFERAGFAVVARRTPSRPVMRHDLA